MAHLTVETCLPKSQLKELLTCPVCMDIFKNPYQLPCEHSICMECLKGILACRPLERQWQPFCCPTCRRDHDLPIGIRKSYTLHSIVDDYNTSSHKEEKRDQSLLRLRDQSTQTNEVSKPADHVNYNRVLNLLLGVLSVVAGFCINYACGCSGDRQILTGQIQRQQNLLMKFKPDISDLSFNKDRANPFLHVSDDLLTVRRLKNPQYYPPHHLRFTEEPQVLSTQCASHGRHYWELEAEGSWDIAVAYETITASSRFGTTQESWTLTRGNKGRLFVYHAGERQRIHKYLIENRVGVVVDFQKGLITFHEVRAMWNHLHTFKTNLNQPVCLGLGLLRDNTTISLKKTFSR